MARRITMKVIRPTEQENEILDRLPPDGLSFSEMIRSERKFLNALLLRFRPKKILEIGVSAGCSSMVILNAIQDDPNAELYSVDLAEQWYRDPTQRTGFVLDHCPDLKKRWNLRTGQLAYRFMDEIGGDIDFVFLDTAHLNPGELLDYLMFLPYLKKNCPVVLHDINLHTFDFRPPDEYHPMTNNVLFAAFPGERLIVGDNIRDGKAGRTPIVNIGGVVLADDARDHVWEIVNAMSVPWNYMPSEEDLNGLQKFFARFYDSASLNHFRLICDFQRFIRIANPLLNRPVRKRLRRRKNEALAKITFGKTREKYLAKARKLAWGEKLANQIRAVRACETWEEMYWDDSWRENLKSYTNALKGVSENDDIIHVCFATDDGYAHAVGAAIASILVNRNPDDQFHFYVFDGGISSQNKKRLQKTAGKKRISIISVDPSRFEHCTLTDVSYCTLATYYRFLIPELSHVKRMIYLDCDVIVQSSLSSLWRHDMNGAYLAGVRDFDSVPKARRFDLPDYINAGVLLFDVEKWRENHLQEKVFDFIRTTKLELFYADQDVINIVLAGKIDCLNPTWNFLTGAYDSLPDAELLSRVSKVNIVHFAGCKKPWALGKRHCLQPLYFRYWKKTPWRGGLLKLRWINFYRWARPRFKEFCYQTRRNIIQYRWSSHKKYLVVFGITLFRFEQEK